MLKIYVNTWGNYNENGAEGGEWITLPMDSDELEETLQRIADKMGGTDPEWAIHDYEWQECQLGPVEEDANIFALNELAEELENLMDYELEALAAALEAEDDGLETHLRKLNSYSFYPGMTLEEVAEQIVNERYDLPEIALRYFDYEAFARDLRFDGYSETAHGVICIC